MCDSVSACLRVVGSSKQRVLGVLYCARIASGMMLVYKVINDGAIQVLTISFRRDFYLTTFLCYENGYCVILLFLLNMRRPPGFQRKILARISGSDVF